MKKFLCVLSYLYTKPSSVRVREELETVLYDLNEINLMPVRPSPALNANSL